MNSHETLGSLRTEILNKAIVHGKVILSSGKEAVIMLICGGLPSIAPLLH
jgi:hypothetical protein